MNRSHPIQLEISGQAAMWTRPDSGACPVSYPAPTFSAVKGIFESILFIQALEIIPYKVEICAPIVYHTYNTNYGGPLRKAKVVQGGGSYQLLASVLINPCYRLYAMVRLYKETKGRLSGKTESWLTHTTSPSHAFQEIFNRRLHRGQNYHVPCLGWKEFTPDYVGVFRPETCVSAEINMTIPSMLHQVFSDGLSSKVQYVYQQNVQIGNGELKYLEVSRAE